MLLARPVANPVPDADVAGLLLKIPLLYVGRLNILPKSYTEEEAVVFGTAVDDVDGIEVDAAGGGATGSVLPDVAPGWSGSVSDLEVESPPSPLRGGERLELKNSERGPLLRGKKRNENSLVFFLQLHV